MNDSKTNKAHLILMLEQMIKGYENLPSQAMLAPVTHYDLRSSLILILELFRASDD
jgi:hypothetical protein